MNIYRHRTSCCGKYLRAITNVLENMVVKIVIKTFFILKTYTADTVIMK
jgi:hypothetical protein